MNCKHFNQSLTAIVAVGVVSLANFSSLAAELAGNVQRRGQSHRRIDGDALRGKRGRAREIGPRQRRQQRHLQIDVGQVPKDSVLYLVAKGGTPKAGADKGPNDAIGLMAVLGTTLPKKVTVNEFTTIASAMTCAQFLNGDALGGKPLGLRIAAGNVPNFVDLETGGYGDTIADALNRRRRPPWRTSPPWPA